MYHMIVEQLAGEPQRMRYNAANGSFEKTEHRSLLYERRCPYAYGWLAETGTPPEAHMDVLLMTASHYPLGARVAVEIIGVFKRADGDHKFVGVPIGEVAPVYPNEDLKRLYPQVGAGEGWFGAREAEALLQANFVSRFQNATKITDGMIELHLDEKTPGDVEKGYVPALKYGVVCAATGETVGYCDLRLGHCENTYYGGHIGYGIDAAHRGHAYAEKACRLLFIIARAHGMTHLYITCNPDNLASKRTCEKLGLLYKGVVALPLDNPMRVLGETEKCLFEGRFFCAGTL